VNLAGKTAIVTGGAVRLGRAIALSLAEARMRVCLHYSSSQQDAEETADQIRALGVDVTLVQADFRKSTSAAARVMDAAVDAFGSVDVLINNAAIFEAGSLGATTEDQWDRHFDINLKTPFFLAQAFARRLEPEQRAHIINIADWRATRPGTDHLAYTLTKSGLVTLTKSLAQSLVPHVQVNAIAPGAILPPPGAEADHLERLASAIPLKRTGSPRDITQALLDLLRSDFITGEVLHVTGGEQL
jgi:NAD(P)-dependent dehydrogenase (short-subunit alcohol dehydrogenase family)